MTDPRDRFRKLDSLRAPDLWADITARAVAPQPRGVRTLPWVLVALALLLGLALGSAALIGSGIVKLPALVEASASPSSTGSPLPSSSPDHNSAPVWTATGPMIQVRAYHAATRLSDGSVLVAGGHTANGFLSSAELYSPSSRSWTATGGMLAARSDLTATPLSDGRVLVAGGQGAGDATLAYTPLASAELYDLTSGSWTPTGNMIEARASHTATALADGRVLVAGGLNASSGSLASAELYDPATGRWTPTGNMIEARASHTATLLPDGSVLVAGGVAMGSDGDIRLASAELYDPNTGSWTATGSMMEPHYFHTATALADGRVLVAGGLNLGSSSKSLASAELYDPRSGSWTAAGDMIQARYWHTAALLVDGKVLIAGGESDIGIGNRLASAELYDPSTGSWTATAAMLYRCAITQTATLLPDGTVLVVGCGSVDAVAAQLYEPGTAPETQH